jgi:hypothetical protein
MMTRVNDQSKDVNGVYLIGFRLLADSTEPDIYTLIAYADFDFPVTLNDQIVFFKSKNSANKAFSYFDDAVKNGTSVPIEPALICDVVGTLYLVNHENADTSSVIVNCLNVMFDLQKATRITFPRRYKTILYLLADHLTFDTDLAAFFNENSIGRDEITDALLWTYGAVASTSMIID